MGLDFTPELSTAMVSASLVVCCVCFVCCAGVELAHTRDGQAAAEPESLGESASCPWQPPVLWLLPSCQGQRCVLYCRTLELKWVQEQQLFSDVH